MREHWLADWLTDWLSKHWLHIYAWYSFPNACIFHNPVVWRVISLFMWFVLSKVLAFTIICNSSAIHIVKEYDFVFISRMFNSHRFIRCSPFWFINPLEFLPVQFFLSYAFFVFCFSCLAALTFTFLTSYLIINFQTKCSSFLQKFYLCFFLANSECDTYQPVDHGLV